jgi:hypothetical protein
MWNGAEISTKPITKWHCKEQTEFKEWLTRNGFDYNDPKLSLGHIKLGQINLEKSFGTKIFLK